MRLICQGRNPGSSQPPSPWQRWGPHVEPDSGGACRLTPVSDQVNAPNGQEREQGMQEWEQQSRAGDRPSPSEAAQGSSGRRGESVVRCISGHCGREAGLEVVGSQGRDQSWLGA